MKVHMQLDSNTAWYTVAGSHPPIVLGAFRRTSREGIGGAELAFRETHGYTGKSECWPASDAHREAVKEVRIWEY